MTIEEHAFLLYYIQAQGKQFIMLKTPNYSIYLSSLFNRSHAQSGIPPCSACYKWNPIPRLSPLVTQSVQLKHLHLVSKQVIWIVSGIGPVLRGCFNGPKVVLWRKFIWKFYALTPLAASQKKVFRPELQHRLSLVGTKLNKILPRAIP